MSKIAETLSYRLTLKEIVSSYGRLHDILSDTIESGRLTEADLPDDYQAIIQQLTGPCGQAMQLAKRLLKTKGGSDVDADLCAASGIRIEPIESTEILTEQVLIDRYGFWGEHPDHSVSDWRYEADNDDTRLGYWSWVIDKIRMAAEDDDDA